MPPGEGLAGIDKETSPPSHEDLGDDRTTQIGDAWKRFEKRFEYAWNFFDFHAKQRMQVFNFFIVFSGIMANAYALSIGYGNLEVAAAVGFVGAIVSFFFKLLDHRNEELVNLAEDILFDLERRLLFKDYRVDKELPSRRNWLGAKQKLPRVKHFQLGIFLREDHEAAESNKDIETIKNRYDLDEPSAKTFKSYYGESRFSHGKWIPVIQWLFCFVFLLGGGFAFFQAFLRS